MRLALLIFAIALPLAVPTTSNAQTSTPIAPCPVGETASLLPPTADAPTTVTAVLTPEMNIQPAAAGDPTSFHYHYYIDLDPATVSQPGQPIPSGNPQIIHSASATQDLGPLAPGEHTVWLVVGQLNHVPCDPPLMAAVSFYVPG